MENVNTEIEITHGIAPSLSDVEAPVIINKAEKSALASKAHADRNPGQVQVLEVARPQPVDGNTRRNGGRKKAGMRRTKSFIEGFAVVDENEGLEIVESSFEVALKAALLYELDDIAYGARALIFDVVADAVDEIQWGNLPKDDALSGLEMVHGGGALEERVDEFLGSKFKDFLLNKRGYLSRIFLPKRKDPDGLLIVKAKLDLATGRVLDVKFYNPFNRAWGDPQEPTPEIREVFEGPDGDHLQEIRKKRLAKRANKPQ
jgi:hypothetical protein